MPTPAYLFTDHSVTLVLNGQAYTINRDHVSFEPVRELLKAGVNTPEEEQRLLTLLYQTTAIQNYYGGRINIQDGYLYYEGEQIHNVVVDRILTFMREGIPHEPLIRFLEKLLENPSRRSVEQLYSFLEHKNLPITPEGNFLAYKAVQENYYDKWSGTIDNHPGQTVEMPRRGVDDNPEHNCSYGYHCGSIEYVRIYGYNLTDRYVIVEVDPKNVVSVPNDHACQKLRVCKYRVVCDYEGVLERPLHTAQNPYQDEDYEEWDGLEEDDEAEDIWDDEGPDEEDDEALEFPDEDEEPTPEAAPEPIVPGGAIPMQELTPLQEQLNRLPDRPGSYFLES